MTEHDLSEEAANDGLVSRPMPPTKHEQAAANDGLVSRPMPPTKHEQAAANDGLVSTERIEPSERRTDVHEMMVLVRDHDERLRGLAYKLLGGDRDRMDDALQDAYLRAFAALPRFRREADPGTWLYRIVYNACIDELRRTERRPEPVDLTTGQWDGPSSRPGPDVIVGTADAAVRALAALPVDQRVTVVLVDGEGFDNVTAARILGVRPGTVASRLSRARASLRRALTDEQAEEDAG